MPRQKPCSQLGTQRGRLPLLLPAAGAWALGCLGAVQYVAATGAGNLALGLGLLLPEGAVGGGHKGQARPGLLLEGDNSKIAVGLLVGAAHLAQVFHAFLAQLGKYLVAA